MVTVSRRIVLEPGTSPLATVYHIIVNGTTGDASIGREIVYSVDTNVMLGYPALSAMTSMDFK